MHWVKIQEQFSAIGNIILIRKIFIRLSSNLQTSCVCRVSDRMKNKSQITQKFESILHGRIGQFRAKNNKLRGNLINYKILPREILSHCNSCSYQQAVCL